MLGVEADLLQVLLRSLVPVAAMARQSEAPLQEPAADWMVDRPNPNAKECELNPTQGRKRRQFEYVVGPTQRPTHVVRNDSGSGDNENICAAERVQAFDPVNEFEGYPPESNS